MKSKACLALAVLVLVSLPGGALAQSAASGDDAARSAPDMDGDRITVGGGVAYMPSYEGSDDYVAVPALAARGKLAGMSFWTRNTQLFVDLVPNPSGPSVDFQAGPIIGINLNRTSGIVDRQVKALGKRKLAVEGGGFVGIGKTGLITSDYDNLTVRIAYVHDVGTVHRSYVVTPMIEYSTPLSRRALVALSASADYAGTGYARTYFDVDAAGSVRSGLPEFSGRKGWKDVTFGILASRSLTGDLLHGLGIYAAGSYTRMENDFAASPVTSIAGSRNQWFGAIGLGYTF